MALRAVSPSLIGREAELADLERALAQAASGKTIVVLLGGEAGVGKSRLLDELAIHARRAGFLVCIGRCIDLGDSAWPLAPLREILQHLVDVLDADALHEVLGPARRPLTGLVPELGNEAPPSEPLAIDLLCSLVVGIVRRLARRAPVLLAFDDLHWADPSTRALFGALTQVGGHGAALLVGTLRTTELHRRHPLLPLIADIERTAWSGRLDLRPLTRADTHALVGELTVGSSSLDASVVDDIYDRTSGVPYYIEELVAAQREGTRRLPASLRDAVLARTALLPDSRATLLDVIAVAERAGSDVLADVTGWSTSELPDALNDLLGTALVVRDGQEFRFRHQLAREVFVDELSPGRRTELHGLVARALERHRPDDTSSIARHWCAALDARRALAACVTAGREALRVGAAIEAEDHLARALEWWAAVPDAENVFGADHAALLVETATAAHHARHADRSLELARRAATELAGVDREREAAVWLQIGDRLHYQRRFSAVTAATDRALDLLRAAAPSALLAHALADAAGFTNLADGGRNRDALAMANEAVAVAEATGDGSAIIHAYYALSCTTLDVDGPAAALPLARGNLARWTPDLPAEDLLMACNGYNLVLWELGAADELIEVCRRGLTHARQTGLAGPRGGWMGIYWAHCLVRLGCWDEVETLRSDLADVLDEVSAPEVDAAWAIALLRRGRLDEARAKLGTVPAGEAAVEATTADASVELAAAAGDLTEVEPLLEAWLQRPVARSGVEASFVYQVMAALSWTAEIPPSPHVRDLAAAWHQRMIEAAAITPPDGLDAVLLVNSQAHWQRLSGQPDPQVWADLAERWRDLRMPYEEALARYYLAEVALSGIEGRSAAGRRRAGDELRRASTIAEELAARPLLARVQDLARRARVDLGADGAHTHHAADPTLADVLRGLTEREREVLDLLAAGRTNGEIGRTLFISTKTASVHVSSILRKLGVTNRVEAAALAVKAEADVPAT